MRRSEKPTRQMDEPLPPTMGPYDWKFLRAHCERVDEMLAIARQLKKSSFTVEGVPEDVIAHVVEVFRGRGLTVLRGRNSMRFVVGVP